MVTSLPLDGWGGQSRELTNCTWQLCAELGNSRRVQHSSWRMAKMKRQERVLAGWIAIQFCNQTLLFDVLVARTLEETHFLAGRGRRIRDGTGRLAATATQTFGAAATVQNRWLVVDDLLLRALLRTPLGSGRRVADVVVRRVVGVVIPILFTVDSCSTCSTCRRCSRSSAAAATFGGRRVFVDRCSAFHFGEGAVAAEQCELRVPIAAVQRNVRQERHGRCPSPRAVSLHHGCHLPFRLQCRESN